ncbi:MAG: PAS domain S-box protein [Candidatus Lokiarchaeota archaeon]|nr:PAS domain S-box protein [Candidatus Lokiarchaeota archaeon]
MTQREQSQPRGSEKMSHPIPKWSIIASSLHDGFAIINEDNEIVFANSSLAVMLDTTIENLLGKKIFEIMTSESRKIVAHNIQTRRVGKSSQYEVELKKSEEESVPVIISGSPIFDESGHHKGSFAVLTDITRIRETELSLMKSEKKFHQVLANSPDIIYRTNLESQQFDFISQASKLILEFDPEEVLEMGTTGLMERVHPHDKHLLEKYRFFQSESPEDITGSHILEYRIRKKSGKYIWVSDAHKVVPDESGQPEYIIGNIRDISKYRDAQDALTKTEILMSNVFASIQDGISILDNQMRIVQVNPTMETWYKHSMPLIGKKCYKAYQGRDQPCVICPTIQSMRDKTANREIIPYIGGAGEVIGWFELYSFPLIDQRTQDITGIIEYVRDVTEREKAEDILRAQRDLGVAVSGKLSYQENLQTILDIIIRVTDNDSGGLYLINKETGNLEMQCSKGLSQEFINATSTYTADSDRMKLIQKGKVLYFDYLAMEDRREAVIRNEGIRSFTSIPLKIDNEVIGCLNITSHNQTSVSNYTRQVIEILTPQIMGLLVRIQAEENTRKSETMYKLLSERSLQGLVILQNDSILFCNTAFCEIIGYSQEEISRFTAEDLWQLIPDNERKEIQDIVVNNSIQPGESKFSRISLIHKDGSIRHVESFVTLIEINEKIITQIVIVDISDRVQAQMQLSNARDRALLYLDLMAHDIRNQLQVILGAVQTVAEISDDEKIIDIVAIAEDGTKRCSKIISKVKSSEKLELVGLKCERIDIILKKAITDFKSDNPSIEIKTDLTNSPLWSYIDQFFVSVIQNILENAIVHNPQPDSEKRIWIRVQSQQKGCEISISDNGKGIPDSQKDSLFDMQRRFGGVSLHLIRQIIEKYGGKIKVQDRLPGEPEKGTEFLLWIPTEIHKLQGGKEVS